MIDHYIASSQIVGRESGGAANQRAEHNKAADEQANHVANSALPEPARADPATCARSRTSERGCVVLAH